MFNSETLDIVIGLVFIYLLYSLFATILQEFIATYLNFRSKILELAIYRMLQDNDKFSSNRVLTILQFLFYNITEGTSTFSGQFYDHPLMKYLGENDKTRRPSYITKDTFSKVVLDILRGPDIKVGDDIKSRIGNQLFSEPQKSTPDSAGSMAIEKQTQTFLRSIWVDAQGDVDKFRSLLENWFDQTMDRATGWYKKYTQIVLLVVGIFLAVAFNVNTIDIVHKLEKDPTLRAQLITQADNFLKTHPNLDKEFRSVLKEDSSTVKPCDTSSLKNLQVLTRAQYEALKVQRDTLMERANRLVEDDLTKTNKLLGLGYASFYEFGKTLKNPLSYIGWIITAIAISLGAPFWFDLLNRLMKIRNSVAQPTTKNTKSSSKS